MYCGKPIIGVTPLYDAEKQSYWMLPGYMKGIEAQGGIPLMLPLCMDREELGYFLESCDGLLLTGGQDVSPDLYGAEKIPQCGETSAIRDEMDGYLLREAIRMDKPMLGICRGIQLLNALLGGTLYQDLPTEHPSDIIHRMQPPYDRPAHPVKIHEDAPLYRLLGKRECLVNSYHHQGIRALAPGCAAMATAPDGLIEGIYLPKKRLIWGVQWHPEFSYASDEDSQKILRALVEAAGGG